MGEGKTQLLDWLARRMLVCVIEAIMEAHTRVTWRGRGGGR
jgi:hypothetical protein